MTDAATVSVCQSGEKSISTDLYTLDYPENLRWNERVERFKIDTAIRLAAAGWDPHALLVMRINAGSRDCPVCHIYLVRPELERRRCLHCRSFLIFEGETIQEMLEQRVSMNLNLDEFEGASNIYIVTLPGHTISEV